MHIHLDLIGGIAGDMFLAAAVDAGVVDIESLTAGLRTLGLGRGISIKVERTRRGALQGAHIRFAGWDPEAEADHRYLTTIIKMIEESEFSENVKSRAIALFRTLGESEARVHGLELENVHFHEVGAVDSILDFVSAAWVIEETSEHVTWSVGSIPTGSGTIETAHGAIPVPVPAVVNLLVGFQLQPTEIASEMVTPTGATILAHLRDVALLKQVISGEKIAEKDRVLRNVGYGVGTKDFGHRANAIRFLVYDQVSESVDPADFRWEKITKISCEIDDMQPEVLAHVCQVVLPKEGAVDVVRIPVVMKKGRMGTQLQVLVSEDKRDHLLSVLFRETRTLGVRVESVDRVVLERRVVPVETPYGVAAGKVSHQGGKTRFFPEFETAVKLAEENQLSVDEAMKIIEATGNSVISKD